MGGTLTEKILAEHLVEGRLEPGEMIGIRVDQCLTQDAFGTLIYLQFEAIGIPRVRVHTVSYSDHNVYQFSPLNMEDHRFIESAAARFGAWFSRPGNGICHQVHRERFAVPGQTLLGSDSHTTTAGGLGTFAVGAGGLDVAVAMGGGPYYFRMPRVVEVRLSGWLKPWVEAKDVVLEMLRRLTVKGGVGRIFEFTGPGVAALNVPDRCTIANMATELGATTAIFPSDEATRDFLRRHGREEQWTPLAPDRDASYAETIELDLSGIEPMIACPSMPDNVVPVSEVAGTPVHQVLVGSCTNGSYLDLLQVAHILRGRQVHPRVNMVIAPASRQALEMLAREGWISDILAAGANLSESTCGACIGVGHVPSAGAVSLRTFNRNFNGRSGLPGDQVYLCSPSVAAASAIEGSIADPRRLGEEAAPRLSLPDRFTGNDLGLAPPPPPGTAVELVRGENIVPLPNLSEVLRPAVSRILTKLPDNVTTDDITPAGASLMAIWSNIPKLSDYTLAHLDGGFVERAKAHPGGVILAGHNYGQGSSREHAALCPRYLGVVAVLAKSFARIHAANLVNFGILPLTLADEADYDALDVDDELELGDLRERLDEGREFGVWNRSRRRELRVRHDLSPREVAILQAGGLLPYTRLHPVA